MNRDNFRDELWEDFSRFHDAKLRKFSVEFSDRVLNIELTVPVYKPDGHINKYLNCVFLFENVNHFSISSEKPTYESSNYAFPVNAAVDSFDVETSMANSCGLGDFYTLCGIYGWSMEWLATGFTRTVKGTA